MRRVLLTLATAFAISVAFLGATRQRAVRPRPVPPVLGPTFSNEVVRIFQQNCQTCHHPGDIAPFSLMDYRSAKPFAASIKFMTQTHQMPPWKPTGGPEFADPRVLSQSDIDTIAQWVDNGAPEGDPAQLPTPLDFGSGWTLGEPDFASKYTTSYTPPASGDMYRCFPIPTNTTENKWVSAIDIHPGDRESVHHVIAFLDTTGASVSLDASDPAPGYTCFGGPGFTPGLNSTLGGWAPGARASLLPDTVALKLPANARIVLQVHYHPHIGAAPKADLTEIGVYYARKTPEKQIHIIPIFNDRFTIPPHDANYRVDAEFPIGLPAMHAWFAAPHMHLLGRKIKMEMTPTGKPAQTLINIDDWDFNWQGMYRYKEPVAIPAYTRLSVTSFYDNSAENWRNPNIPPKPVSWGEATTDEMCIGFLGVTFDGDDILRGFNVDVSKIPVPTWR